MYRIRFEWLLPKMEISFSSITVERFFPGDRLQPADGPIFVFHDITFEGIPLEEYPEKIQSYVRERLERYSETLDYREYMGK